MTDRVNLPARVARAALVTVKSVLRGAPVTPDIVVVSRNGKIIAHEA